jgi:hypothetical protein
MYSVQITSLPKSHTLFAWLVSGMSDGVASVPRTRLTKCFDADGIEINCTGTG